MRILKTTMYCWISGLFLLASVGNAQSPSKDTIWVPVTYFDFRSDYSNPEFEQSHFSGFVRNMVNPTLDKDTLPQLGAVTNLNKYIQYWYRDWSAPNGSKSVDSIPVYNNGNFVNFKKVTLPDTAFMNIVIHDSLPFTRDPNNRQLYQYDDTAFFPLDGRGFGNEGRAHNFSFTMSLHYTFTKTKSSIKQTFNFRGDDDVWAFIDNQLVLDLGGVHEPLTGSFVVSDTLIPNKQYQFDFFSAERHTTQSNIRIQTNLFEHIPPIIDFSIAPNDTIGAGDTAVVTAQVKMDGEVRADLENKVIWSFVDSTETRGATLWCDKIGNNVGNIVHFTAEDAFKWYFIKAGVYDSIDEVMKYKTVQIYVKAGSPDHLVIEENPFKNGDFAVRDSLNDNPISGILITSTDTIADAYAVVRDAFQNICGPADPLTTVWSQTDPYISTTGESNHKYHGIIIRRSDNAITYAVVNQPNQPPIRGDSVLVELSRACIDSLRVKDASGKIVTKIEMTSGEKRSYTVEGFKSTTSTWISVDAKWELVPVIKSTTPPPDRNQSWTFDPTEPGQSNLILSRPFDTSCQSRPVLTIPVKVSIEKITSVRINIVTPVSDRIAGDTLLAVVEVRNSDGLVPGNYCLGTGGNETTQVIYQDTLRNPNGGRRPLPQIWVDGVWTTLNTGFTSEVKNNQCFMNGVDTIKFISYFAPFVAKDSMHLLTIDIGASRKDQESFSILPAILDSIDITDLNHISITDIVTFTADTTGRYYISVGYDKYGNKRGDELTDWKTTGEIRRQSTPSTSTVNYSPGKVDFTQDGFLVSEVVVNGKNIQDKIEIRATGLPAILRSAYTHDDNGNGYLDRISISFDKRVTIAEDATSLFSITNGISNNFKVTKILPIDADGMRYSIYLEEIKSPTGQTDWKPLFSTSGQSDFSAINTSCSDSAAPVVWTAIKTVNDPRDPTKDVLVITMSEKIKKSDNNNFTTTNQPDLTFYVWKKNALDTTKYDNVPLLKDISGFQETSVNSFTILMTNGCDITKNNYINIKAINNTLIDVPGNFPGENNIKRQVEVHAPPNPPTVIPNPTSPSFEHTGPGVLVLSHDDQARKYARKGLGAAINVLLPHAKPGETVNSHIKIYDIVGNMVNSSYNNDFLKVSESNASDTGSVHIVDIYWNGSNAKGMKVAPGIYRTVLYFEYSQKSTKNLRYIVNIGIKK